MNNRFIFTENNVIVSAEKGNLKVTNNCNLNKRLKLENNLEVLHKKYESLEYIVDDNYEYTFKVAEYVEPEKPLSLARIKRDCREKLDKKRI